MTQGNPFVFVYLIFGKNLNISRSINSYFRQKSFSSPSWQVQTLLADAINDTIQHTQMELPIDPHRATNPFPVTLSAASKAPFSSLGLLSRYLTPVIS